MSSYGSPSLHRRAVTGEGGGGGEVRSSRASSVDYDKARPPPANKSVQQLRDTPPALDFLARRGSEAEASTASEVESAYEEEAMANAERELAADAEWKRIQQNTFTRSGDSLLFSVFFFTMIMFAKKKKKKKKSRCEAVCS